MLMQYKRRNMIVYGFVLYGLLAAISLSDAYADDEVVLKCQVGVTANRDNDEFYQGEPILFRVNVKRVDKKGKEKVLIGTNESPWYENVVVSVYRIKETPSEAATSAPADTPANPDHEDDGTKIVKEKVLLKDVKAELCDRQPVIKELGMNKMARSFWAIDPVVTAKWPPGKYVIQAVYDTSKKQYSDPDIFKGTLQSNEVIIIVNEPEGDEAKAEIFVLQAGYNIRQKKYDLAVKLLNQALQLDPAKKGIHCSLGRAYELKGDTEAAIKEYQAYVDWVRSLNRPRTGKDDINDYADRIEEHIKLLQKKTLGK